MQSLFKVSSLICGLLLTVQAFGQNNVLVVELESLSGQSLFAPFVAVNDSAASGGKAIEWPNNGANQNFATPADTSTGQVQISFTLSQTANVTFQMLANLAGQDNDSFHYKLDSGAWTAQNNLATSGYGTITPITFSNLAAGAHTLRIVRREDGSRLDRVTLTASAGSFSGNSSSSSTSSSSSSTSTSSGSCASSSGGFDSTTCNINTPQNWPCNYNTPKTADNPEQRCGCKSWNSSGGICGCITVQNCSDPTVWNSQCNLSTPRQYQPCNWNSTAGFGGCSMSICGGTGYTEPSSSSTSSSSSSSSSTSSSSGSISSSSSSSSSSTSSSSSSSGGAGGISCTAKPSNTGGTAFQVDVSVTNGGATTPSGWKVTLVFPEQVTVTNQWNATRTGTNPGTSFQFANCCSWQVPAPGHTVSNVFGVQGTHDGSFMAPDCISP